MTQDRDFDVIVVGGGGAGMSAAIMAADAGASVLLIEADAKLGGSTALSGGVYYAAGTSVQRVRVPSGQVITAASGPRWSPRPMRTRGSDAER